MTENYGAIRRVNLGSNTLMVAGEEWLNIDVASLLPRPGCRYARWDLSDGLPPGVDGLDLVTSSEFFEHIDLLVAERIVRSSAAKLRPGGTFRVATPDLTILLDALRDGTLGRFAASQPRVYGEYRCPEMKFAILAFGALSKSEEYTGHRHLYTFAGLREVLERGGLVDVRRDRYRPEWGDAPVAHSVGLSMYVTSAVGEGQ